jgi:small-conductance mechanosensitive channel
MPVPILIRRLLQRTRTLFIIFLAAWIIPLVVTFPPQYEARITRLLHYTAVLALFAQGVAWVNALVSFWTDSYIERHRIERGDLTTIRAVAVVVRVAFVALLLLAALEALGLSVTGVITGLGIGGIAVAFALQNILADLFGAFSIVLDKPFVIGDAIQVDTMSGTVERIGLKSTRVRSDDGEEIIFANGDLLRGRIRNFGRMEERRAVLTIRVDGDTPPETLARIPALLRQIVEAQPDVRFGRAHLRAIGDATIDFETVYYLRNTAYKVLLDTQQTVMLAVLRRCAQDGIELSVQLETAQKKKIAGRG